jgi:hypothetical protein
VDAILIGPLAWLGENFSPRNHLAEAMIGHKLLYLVALWSSLAFSMHGIPSTTPTLVIIDGFSEYLSGECKAYCEEHGIRVVEAISPYICNMFKAQGREVPESLRAPVEEEEIFKWSSERGLIDERGDGLTSDMSINQNTFIISESDSGVSTAENLAAVLNLPGNGVSPHLRNKYLSNQKAKAAGIEVLKQKLVCTWEEAQSFVEGLWVDCDEADRKCVVKPYR